LRGRDAVTIRLLIADDHKVVRQGLRMVLELDPDLEVVGEASNGEEALRMVRRLEPDVVLMDLLMPVMSGIEATREIRRELPKVEVVALTSVLEDASVAGAIRAGRSATSSRTPRPTSYARRLEPRRSAKCTSLPRPRHA